MISSVSNDGIECSLNFGPDSLILTVQGLISEKNNMFPGNSSCGLEVVVVSKTKFFDQPSSASSNYC